MLELGGFRARVCAGVSRRAFLRMGSALPLAMCGGAQPAAASAGGSRPASVILLWLWGGPSHLDTFDPKPHAPATYRGPFGTIATRTTGVHFTELLSGLAARSNLFSLVRSNQSNALEHPEAGTLALTGVPENPTPTAPNFGSIVGRHHGGGVLPPFISVGQGTPRDVVRHVVGYGGGKWGKAYDPFSVACSERGEVDIPALALLDGLSPGRLADRRLLRSALDEARRRVEGQQRLEEWSRTYGSAYGLLTSADARRALDLSLEGEAARTAYGQTSFGQSCLLARRLVEAGVPYIQVNWSQYVECMTPNCDFGWDTHIYNFELLADRHCPIFDRACSALLDDLRQRGMLDSTLVVAVGEFGRTPRINATASRDHWPNCYFSLWAGGGVRPGRLVGQSDRMGQEPASEPITPAMVGATICELAGVGAQARAELRVLSGARVIHELVD